MENEKFETILVEDEDGKEVEYLVYDNFEFEGGTFVALKGAKAQEEIDEAKEAIKILGGEIADVKQIFLSDMGERNIVVIKKVSPTPPKYPRASAKIAKEPLGMPKK